VKDAVVFAKIAAIGLEGVEIWRIDRVGFSLSDITPTNKARITCQNDSVGKIIAERLRSEGFIIQQLPGKPFLIHVIPEDEFFHQDAL
jgi:hypothetical protein